MSGDKAIEILDFVRKELSAYDLDLDTSLTTGKEATLEEDVLEMMEKYSERFKVDCSNLGWVRYFPREGIPFVPNFLLPERFKTDHYKPLSLTVRMLVESEKAGRWLYD
ncbi:hypothetical protein BIY26_13275 [Brenneria goodwinii]|uniref:Acyl carrier protein n=1 Tax=Brenneria goodwinii TaxID=1109412 RepID=A0A0G4JSJ6_9GAMM|nr:DUF1493 family protein [Brenneria goodwinii]ATA25770.1 hypothetical protein AWC36_17560 [Brenneria goodwinii]RLM22424.1 hypothetical protein BIY26_13275 [Brenneria goodwinii]CPR15130.1 hypothetical protein BN1221_01335c [Brenneria goodwinii]